jgi:endonuclease/exonuclease/phosphatase (EEP) superfamily protein YafD
MNSYEMLIVFQLIALLTITVSVSAIIWQKAWWIRVLDFPRLQIISLQIISCAGIIFLTDKYNWWDIALLELCLVALIIQVSFVFPYLPFTAKDVKAYNGKPEKTVSLMVANVLMHNRKANKLIALIEKYKPEIVLVIEADSWWDGVLDPLIRDYNHSVRYPLENTYGMLLFSKHPLNNATLEFLVKENVPSIQTEVLKDDFVFKLFCLHPEPPAPDEAKTTTYRDRELVTVAKKVLKEPAPYIVLGDLNDVAWSETSYKFRMISGLKDPRIGRGFYNSYHARIPLMRWALDHVFVSDEFQLIDLKLLPDIGSDHFPVYIELAMVEL